MKLYVKPVGSDLYTPFQIKDENGKAVLGIQPNTDDVGTGLVMFDLESQLLSRLYVRRYELRPYVDVWIRKKACWQGYPALCA